MILKVYPVVAMIKNVYRQTKYTEGYIDASLMTSSKLKYIKDKFSTLRQQAKSPNTIEKY